VACPALGGQTISPVIARVLCPVSPECHKQEIDRRRAFAWPARELGGPDRERIAIPGMRDGPKHPVIDLAQMACVFGVVKAHATNRSRS